MPLPSLTVAKNGPVDHVAASRDHQRQAREHALEADRESRESLSIGAEHFGAMADLEALPAGIREHYGQVAKAMNAAAQGIAAVSAKVSG
jgi:hypothetical protein